MSRVVTLCGFAALIFAQVEPASPITGNGMFGAGVVGGFIMCIGAVTKDVFAARQKAVETRNAHQLAMLHARHHQSELLGVLATHHEYLRLLAAKVGGMPPLPTLPPPDDAGPELR